MATIDVERLSFLDGAYEERPYLGVPPAVTERRGWDTDNSDFATYSHDVIFPGFPGGLKEIIERFVGRNLDNVGMDIAGGRDGIALQDLLRSGILREAILTNLLDRRSATTKANKQLHLVEGNLIERSTWEKILARQQEHAPDGLALVMHRPVGGLQSLQPAVYKDATHLILDMTRPGGVFFCQIPSALLWTSGGIKLGEICSSIRNRSDVELAIPSSMLGVDEMQLDTAVIVKRSSS